MTRGPFRVLEMVLFVVVFVAGSALTWLAITGDDRRTPVRIARPLPGPGGATAPPSLPPLGEELPEGELGGPPGVVILQTDAEVVPPPSGCNVTIIYSWNLDPSAMPLPRRAVISFDGPEKSGEYPRRVQGNRVEFRIRVNGAGVYTADIASFDGRETFPSPIPVTLSFPGC